MIYRVFLVFLVSCMFSGCSITIKKFFSEKPLKTEQKQDIPRQHKEVWVEAKTSRIWVNPSVDENGAMIEGHYKYIVVEPGHWAVRDQ